MKNFFSKTKSGFTLIELLVVIAIIAILASILVPAVTSALDQGKMTTVLNNGKNIYLSIFASQLEDPLGLSSSSRAWPEQITGARSLDVMGFPNSTDYLRWVVEEQVMNVDFSFFGAPDLPIASSLVATNFTADNNAWVVTVGVGNTSFREGAPALFTKNFRQNGNPLPNIGITPTLDPDQVPFSDKGGIVVLKGGSAFILKQDSISNRFNRVGGDNVVLYP